MKYSGRNSGLSSSGHESNLMFMLSILLISLILGGGVVWLYCDYRYENTVSRLQENTLKLEACVSNLDLKRNMETTLLDIITLTGKYQKMLSIQLKNRYPLISDTLIPLQEELDNLKRLYSGYEEKLAKIENRNQRQIGLNFYDIQAK